MSNLVALLIITVIIGGAAMYVYSEKKKGTKCIGCASSGKCSSKTDTSKCNCGNH